MSNPFSGTTPSITVAQAIGAGVVAAGVLLQHYGWMTTDVFFGVVATAGVLKFSDAGLRGSRNVARAAELHLAATAIASAPAQPDHVDVKVAKVSAPGASTSASTRARRSPTPPASS